MKFHRIFSRGLNFCVIHIRSCKTEPRQTRLQCLLGCSLRSVMASPEVYKVLLSGGAPWGFRLQGGSEFRAPLRIAKITPGSKAQKANIYEGLYVRAINDCPSERLTHSEALNIVKKTGNQLELELCWKPETPFQPPTGGSYTTEDIQNTHVSKATFKPSSSQAPPYATLPRGGPGWKEVDENFNETYAIEDFPPPPEMPPKVFEKPHPIGRGGRRFEEYSSNQYYGRPPLTSSSIGSEEDFNMANGDTSSQDSNQQHSNSVRPAMNQFRKQKVNAEIEATREPKPIPKKIPPPPPAKPERRYHNIMEEERYKGPSRPAIRRGGKWYKEMFKEMHSTAGVSSNLSALLANDAVKAGEEHLNDGPTGEFVHPMQARPVEYEPSTQPDIHEPRRRRVTPPVHRPAPAQMSPPSHIPSGGVRQGAQDHVPTWYQDVIKGERIPKEEPVTYGVHHRKTSSYDSSDEGKPRFSGLQSPVHANRPPDYVPPLSRSAADRNVVKTIPPMVTVQQEERSKPPTATSLYEQRFRGTVPPGHNRKKSASEELGVKHQPPSDEELMKKREEEARHRREEEERRRREEERELVRRHQEEQARKEQEAEMRRRKQEAAAVAQMKAVERPQFFAMALYNFAAQSPKELSFKKGDYIVVKRQIDRNWIEGEISGKIGIFPANHVELRPIDDEEESAETPTSPYVAVEGEARLKYTFEAQTPRELSIGKNEVVTLTRRVDQNWYEAFSQGRKGIVPAAYVEVLREPGLTQKGNLSPKATGQIKQQEPVHREEPIQQIYTQPVSHSPQQVTEIRKTTTTTTYDQRPEQPRSYGEPIRIPAQQSRSPPRPQVQYISKEPEPTVLPAQFVEDHQLFPMEGERYKAAYSYAPQNDDELPLEEGEEVIVLEKCDDGWFVGHSIRTGLFGTFPGNYVAPL